MQYLYSQKLILQHIKAPGPSSVSPAPDPNSGSSPDSDTSSDTPIPDANPLEAAESFALVNLWGLATLLAIHTIGQPAIPLYIYDYIYETTTAGCLLRRYAVDYCLAVANEHFVADDPEYLPREMITDFATAVLKRVRAGEESEPFEIEKYYVEVEKAKDSGYFAPFLAATLSSASPPERYVDHIVMEDSDSTDAARSRRSQREKQSKKKQKTPLSTFSDGRSLVTFLVGPSPTPTEYQVHKEAICLLEKHLTTYSTTQAREVRFATTISPAEDAINSRREDRPSKKFKAASTSFSRDPKSLVTFIVGPEGSTKEFLVHKEVACHHSDVLKAAFNSGFIEGSTQTYRLEDVSEGAFNFLIQWLYSQKLNLLVDDPDHVVNTKDEGEDCDEDMHLAELWTLADRLNIPKLQNAVIDAFHSIFISHECLLCYSYHYIYQNTTANSKLRKYVCAPFAQYITLGFIKETAKHYPSEMLVDIAEMLLSQRNSKYTWDISVEDY
ncbi:hypothetical protein IFR05_011462 [Cadophora sp. M221]|nr:hypothetical protein IFR05_011462 [Cadophora sp. M221]